LTLEDGTDNLSRNVGNKLPIYAALTSHKSEDFRCKFILNEHKQLTTNGQPYIGYEMRLLPHHHQTIKITYVNNICSDHRGYEKLIRNYRQKMWKEKITLEGHTDTDLT